MEKDVLFHFIPELNNCAERVTNNPDRGSAQMENLRGLIDHLKQTHAAT